MYPRGLFTIICLFLFSVGKAGSAPYQNFSVRHYTDEDGLPQNSIKSIMKDGNGFIWLATEDGFVRFDGRKFYTFNKRNTNISSNRIYGLVPAISDFTPGAPQLYARCENGELLKVLDDGGVEVDKKVRQYNLRHVPLAKKGNEYVHMLLSLPSQFPLTNIHHPFVLPIGKAAYYVWQNEEIQLYKNARKLASVKGRFNEVFLLDTHPFVRTAEGEFLGLSDSLDAVTPLRFEGAINSDESIVFKKLGYRFFWNNMAQTAFLYANNTLFEILKSKRHGFLNTRVLLRNFDFNEHDISSVFYDERARRLFLGSTTQGVFVISQKEFQTVRREGQRNEFYAQIPYDQNTILSSNGYLMTHDLLKGETREIFRSKEMLSWNGWWYTAQNKDSSFWIGNGSASDLLYRMSKRGDKILAKHRMLEKFKALYMDDRDTLWIGGEKGTLACLNTNEPNAIPKIITNRRFGEVSFILRTPESLLLLGTKKGLFRFDIRSKKVEKVGGLDHANVRSLHRCGTDLWITTYGDGIFHLRGNKLTRLPLDKDQYLAASHCIIEDKNGFFWVTTNKGLFRVLESDLVAFVEGRAKSVFYYYYDKRHGFEINEFNGGCEPCALHLADGVVSMPSMNGFVWFKPDKVDAELADKRIFIEHVELDGHVLDRDNEIEVPRHFEELYITLTTPYFDHDNNIQMEYAIGPEGVDRVLHPISSDFRIAVPNLGYGRFLLTIRKRDGFGADHFSWKTIKIFVRPAWYETWTFRFFSALLLIVLFWMILKYRTAYLLRQERRKNLYKQYHINSQIVTAINHDIQTPLHYISTAFEQIQKHLKSTKVDDPYIEKLSEETINTIRYAGSHTSNLLNYIKSQNRGNRATVKIGQVDVFEIVENSCKLLSGTARHREILLENKIRKGYKVRSDAQLLPIIIQNLLDNAVKLSDETVTISSASTSDHQLIRITDTAKGFPSEILKWLNGEYKSYDEWLRDYEYPDHKGLGLVIVKDLTVLLGITVSAENSGEKGSVVELIFKL